MRFERTRIKAIVFDYGNTLVEFGETQTAICDGAMADVLKRLYGPLDPDRFRAVRNRAGMVVAHSVQWTPHERFDRKPGDHDPDLVVRCLAELETHVSL
jgi:FMN phosphatase YigB (HAD superfamily)